MENDPFLLKIEIEDNETVYAKTGGGAELAKGKLGLTPVQRRTIALFEEWLREGKITKRNELEVLGSILYEAIFNGEVHAAFQSKLDDLRNQRKDRRIQDDRRLHVELRFTQQNTKLAMLPWEFLFSSQSDTKNNKSFFLAAEPILALTRYIPLPVDRESLMPPEGKLKILTVVSQPEGMLAEMEEADAKLHEPIINKLKELERKYPITIINSLSKPTIEGFIQALECYKPDVVHYIGHGRYKDDEFSIALINESDSTVAEWCSNRTFADYFQGVDPRPRLVFLHLCQGPQNEAMKADFIRANFAELAYELIRMQIQAVVAMQYPIKRDLAQKFTDYFYGSITKQQSVATAVQEGRRWTAMLSGGYTNHGFATPVIYMHSNDGRLLPAPSGPATRESGTSLAQGASSPSLLRAASVTEQVEPPVSEQSSVLPPAPQSNPQNVSLGLDIPLKRSEQLPNAIIIELSRVARKAAQDNNLDADNVVKIICNDIVNKDIEEIKQLFRSQVSADPWSPMAQVYDKLVNNLDALPST